MISLSKQFYSLVDEYDDKDRDPAVGERIVKLVNDAPAGPERDGLLALMYHDAIGVERDLEKAFSYAESAADDNEGVALYLLGFMCEHGETPDQLDGGPRQKYDHYDAERFMEMCSHTSSSWAEDAHLWLGHFFMDMARGGDPEIAVEHFEAIADNNAEAAGELSDYYWNLWENGYAETDEEIEALAHDVNKWTREAVRLNPHDYSYRMGCCYAEGLGCEANFRLARKYWEDAYAFGEWWAADAIAALFEQRLESLGPDAPETERVNCRKHIESWRKLARREQERQAASEPDPSVEED